MKKYNIKVIINDIKNNSRRLEYLSNLPKDVKKQYFERALYQQGQYYASMGYPIEANDNPSFREGYEQVRSLKK